MPLQDERESSDGASDAAPQDHPDQMSSSVEIPTTPLTEEPAPMNGSANVHEKENQVFNTPPKTLTKRVPATTPRIKKKVPWKGKNILVLIPRDEERGEPGKAPLPLDQSATKSMLKEWEQLGYDVRGFDLEPPPGVYRRSENSQSRGAWPDFDDIDKERSTRNYKVLLPDLNAWKKYVADLNEAKLRALGVSFGDEEPPLPPSVSPGSTLSRQASITTHYPPLPFSPPLPTSSASSNQAIQGFPFPAAFASATSAVQSPSIASPVSFVAGGKFNPRASISVASPHAWSPQVLLQHRTGSPSLANLSGLMSPTSPFTDGMPVQGAHQRHQSVQYSMMNYQFPSRTSPRMQELREDEEEDLGNKSPSQTPEAGAFVRHQVSDSRQQEIEAEYHLEEQMRSQLDNDQDYSPHNEMEMAAGSVASATMAHARDSSVQFAQQQQQQQQQQPPPPLFSAVQSEAPVLHHPRPHSRGHSLSQHYFTEEDATKQGTFEHQHHPTRTLETRISEESEIETNPSNLGTPIQSAELGKMLHERSFSTASNPWTDNESGSGKSFTGSIPRRASHDSKPSLSKLNVQAPEFKFNPTSTFNPGQFVFSSNNFQPNVFNAGLHGPASANSSQFSLPMSQSSSRINANVPTFSPGQSDFSFSAIGPKFRADAPAFTPLHSFSNSVNSPASSGDGTGHHRPGSIFGNIDLSGSEIVKPVKKSKAIPIVRPPSRSSSPQLLHEGPEGPVYDESRVKRARASAEPDDSEGRFLTEEVTPVPESKADAVDAHAEDKPNNEDGAQPGDSTLSSTMVSDATDSKTSPSPAVTSPDQSSMKWTPFEFRNQAEMQNFNDARPFGEDNFQHGHKKSLSATAKAFVPGASFWTPADGGEQAASGNADELEKELLGDETAAAEPTRKELPVEEPSKEGTEEEKPAQEVPGVSPVETTEAIIGDEPMKESVEEPVKEPAAEPARAPSQSPVSKRLSGGLSGSRFAASAPSEAPTPTKGRGLAASRFAAAPARSSSPPPPPKPAGLLASRFAAEPPSTAKDDESEEKHPTQASQRPVSPPPSAPSITKEDEVEIEHGQQQLPQQDVVSPAQAVQDHADRFSVMLSPISKEDEVEDAQAVASSYEDEDEAAQEAPELSLDDELAEPDDLLEDGEIPQDEMEEGEIEEGELEEGEIDEGQIEEDENQEPGYAKLDDIMRHLNENPHLGVNRTINPESQWRRQDALDPKPSLSRHISLTAVSNSSPLHLPPHGNIFRSDAPSPSPQQYRHHAIDAQQPLHTTELEDPFIDPSHSFASPVHNLNGDESVPVSDWEGAFSDEERTKLETRVNFFDGHVNDLVDGLLAARLQPVEETLDTIRHVLGNMTKRPMFSRQERRSISAEIQMSDADDEDEEEPMTRRSMSPRRDRRMEQIRTAVLDAFATQQRNMPPPASPPSPAPAPTVTVDDSAVLKALEDFKEQFSQSLRLDLRSEDFRNVVEDVFEKRMPVIPQPTTEEEDDDESAFKIHELQARVVDLEHKLRLQEEKVESEIMARRAAEDRAADIDRKLQSAETRVEVEIMNKSIFDQRVTDLEDRLHQQEGKVEDEWRARRSAEDQLSELQRLLRVSGEEEARFKELAEQREQKVKALEASHGKSAMRLTLLEASQTNAQQSQTEAQNRINALEADLREARQESRHWRGEVDHLGDTSRRHEDDLTEALNENRAMHKLIETLGTQLEENERMREQWRAKFIALQEEMTYAAREIAEENSRRTKREQAQLARQEVLDAKLQAEARTRERIETELERLEMGERQGMRAVAECKRLEAVLSEMRTENHKLHQSTLRFQAEFQEARESGAREVQRTRESMQAEVESANHQVNVVREELEDQVAKLRAQLDQVKMDADTARARHEMLLEESQSTKTAELQELNRKHQSEMEDMQAHYERQLSNTTEDAQRAERNLLERLSISSSKAEFLQGQVAHLEERLEIAKAAAHAAAQAAKSSALSASSSAPSVASVSSPVADTALLSQPIVAAVPQVSRSATTRPLDLPEKISPQALRESIAALQEQLQQREQTIEELEQVVERTDPEADTKIAKRDEEISWLRELLAVRHSDLHDIILALSRDDYDRNAVKDAAIRLKANLQMEEQERERAMNGGSAISLPNLAATLRDATPRVAQAVGPLAAAWGNWRKSANAAASSGGFSSISSVLSSSSSVSSNGNNATPSKNSAGAPPQGGKFLSGLLTPPASTVRQQTPPTTGTAQAQQPTAFSSTGRRFTSEDLANRPRPMATPQTTQGAKQVDKAVIQGTPPRPTGRTSSVSSWGPVTPQPLRPSAYDADAQAEDFDDAGFFDDD